MKRVLAIASALLLAAACTKTQAPAEPQIIPRPEHLQMLDGSFSFTRNTLIAVDASTDEYARTARMLSSRCRGFTVTVFRTPIPSSTFRMLTGVKG